MNLLVQSPDDADASRDPMVALFATCAIAIFVFIALGFWVVLAVLSVARLFRSVLQEG